jgi:hypothetical protein
VHGVEKTLYLALPCAEVTYKNPYWDFDFLQTYESAVTRTYESDKLVATHTYGVLHRTMLTALGDYWYEYFEDIDTLSAITTGVTVLCSEVYNSLLELVLSSSI